MSPCICNLKHQQGQLQALAILFTDNTPFTQYPGSLIVPTATSTIWSRGKCLSLHEIEPRILGHPIRSLITVLNGASQNK